MASTPSRLNVILYRGQGADQASADQTYQLLRRFLHPNYDVLQVTDAKALWSQPWEESTALLVIPGGRHVSYIEHLPLDKLRCYVRERRGLYLGIGAGACIGSCGIEFRTARDQIHDLERADGLGFWQGTAKGPAYSLDDDPGLKTRAVSIKTSATDNGYVAYHEGCWFDSSGAPQNVLAEYDDGRPAMVHCEKRQVVLTGLRLELDPENCADAVDPALQERLQGGNAFRLRLVERVLADVFRLTVDRPSLNYDPPFGPIYVHGDQHGLKTGWFDGSTDQILSDGSVELNGGKRLWQIKAKDGSPDFFDISRFADSLRTRKFGRCILASDCVTSTQSLLQENAKLRANLPSGAVFVVGHQTEGKGRGRNSWLSSAGCLMFTVLFKYNTSKPGLAMSDFLFAQYLVALAMAEAFPSILRIKWPNDLYAETSEGLKKVGGVLVNSFSTGSEITLLMGCGLNIANPRPTVSLSQLLDEPLSLERSLASVLNSLERVFDDFIAAGGFHNGLADRYYAKWLHTSQAVMVQEGIVETRILGLDEYGYLRGITVDGSNKVVSLDPDGNTFDMLRGLVIKKQ